MKYALRQRGGVPSASFVHRKHKRCVTCNVQRDSAATARHACKPAEGTSRWAGLATQWASFNPGTTFQSRMRSPPHTCRIRDEFNSDWSLTIASLSCHPAFLPSITVSLSPTFLKFSGSSVSSLVARVLYVFLLPLHQELFSSKKKTFQLNL